MEEIIISPVKIEQIPAIGELLGKAYAGNPVHVVLFGKDNFISNERMFKPMLNRRKGDLFTAELGGVIVGTIGMEKHPKPFSPESQPPQFTPESLLTSEAVIARLHERSLIWQKMELKEKHYHFGPVAVLPQFQHKGIGNKMMEYCCRILDREAEVGYLETEGYDNLRFYSKFGFKAINEIPLFGVPAFFMKRLPLPV